MHSRWKEKFLDAASNQFLIYAFSMLK